VARGARRWRAYLRDGLDRGATGELWLHAAAPGTGFWTLSSGADQGSFLAIALPLWLVNQGQPCDLKCLPKKLVRGAADLKIKKQAGPHGI